MERSKQRHREKRLRQKWLAFNKPDANGFYTCVICETPVHVSEVSMDHIAPWSLYPELRYDLSNLQATHVGCNVWRGKFIRKLRASKGGYHRQTMKQKDPQVILRMQNCLLGIR